MYQYVRGVIAAANVSVNRDTTMQRTYSISEVIEPQTTSPEHADHYIFVGVDTLIESDSTRVAIQPVAYIPDSDARLVGDRWYVYSRNKWTKARVELTRFRGHYAAWATRCD